MKTIIRITALCIAMLLSVSMLASCDLFSKSMDDIVDKIKDLDEDEYVCEKMKSSDKKDFVEMMEELYDIELDGDIATMYTVSGEEFQQAYVIEFESSKDAKAFVEGMQEYIDELDEDGEDYEFFEEAVLERSGKIVIFATSDEIVDEIW